MLPPVTADVQRGKLVFGDSADSQVSAAALISREQLPAARNPPRKNLI